MKKLLTQSIAAFSLSTMALAATTMPAAADPPRHAQERGKGHWKGKGEGHWKHGDHDRRYVDRYYANRYYRSGYAPIRVTRATRIYRGSDDRYYCKRSDGTTGLIIGAAVGGVIGNQVAQGDSKTLGTILGASAGALLGRAIDRGDVVCR